MALLRALIVFWALSAAGCGLLAGDGHGTDGDPISGGGPYGKITDPTLATKIDEPYVIRDSNLDFTSPSAIALDGGGYRVFFTRTSHAGGASEIWSSDLTSLHDFPIGPPVRALAASRPWENGTVMAPSVQDQGGGQLLMVYQGGTSAGRAVSSDGGVTWTKDAQPLMGNALHPSMVTLPDGRAFLYFARPGFSGIWVATSDDGMVFTANTAPVLDTSDDPAAFDRTALAEPSAVGGVTATGQLHLGLFYQGRADNGSTEIGYAGSADGIIFQRANQGKPALNPTTVSVEGPGPLISADVGVLFFSQQRAGIWSIAAATSPGP
jgi:hypothetical protein